MKPWPKRPEPSQKLQAPAGVVDREPVDAAAASTCAWLLRSRVKALLQLLRLAGGALGEELPRGLRAGAPAELGDPEPLAGVVVGGQDFADFFDLRGGSSVTLVVYGCRATPLNLDLIPGSFVHLFEEVVGEPVEAFVLPAALRDPSAGRRARRGSPGRPGRPLQRGRRRSSPACRIRPGWAWRRST